MKVLACLLGSSATLCAQIHVPGDHPTLQEAIDHALPGDVVVVAAGPAAPVVIDKALTILFETPGVHYLQCDQDPGCFDCPNPTAFLLAGPGSGSVTIAGVVAASYDCFYPASALEGGGFDQVHLIDWTVEISAGHSGIGHGATAIDVAVPFLVVTDSTIRASGSDSDHCTASLFEDLAAGIRNPGGTVLVVDSEVTGGSGGWLCCIDCGCPAMPSPSLGGTGGPGIVASEVLVAGSTVAGGTGSTFLSYPEGSPYSPFGVPTDCGKQDDGPAFVAGAVHVLEGTLGGPSTAQAGGTYTLEWDLPGPAAYLFFAPGLQAPAAPAAASGFVLVDDEMLSYLGPIAAGGGPAARTIDVPGSSALIGIELCFQALDETLGVTRPVLGLIVP